METSVKNSEDLHCECLCWASWSEQEQNYIWKNLIRIEQLKKENDFKKNELLRCSLQTNA